MPQPSVSLGAAQIRSSVALHWQHSQAAGEVLRTIKSQHQSDLKAMRVKG
jgi:hypothetical protein